MTALVCDPHLDMGKPPARWLSADQKRVLLAVYKINIGGGMPRPGELAAELALPIEDVKAALRILIGHDLVRSAGPI